MDIRFDDIPALQAQISDAFGEWGSTVMIDQVMIDRFADLTGDHQWIHVHPERAREGPFGTTIAHGFLVIALLPRVRPPLGFGIVGESSRVNYGAESYRFLAPVPEGATIHARARLAAVRSHPQGTLLVQENEVSVVGAQRPSLLFRGMLLYRP